MDVLTQFTQFNAALFALQAEAIKLEDKTVAEKLNKTLFMVQMGLNKLCAEVMSELKAASAASGETTALCCNDRNATSTTTNKENEMSYLPKTYKYKGIVGKPRKKENGVIEIRCVVNKVPYYGAGKNLDIAKKAFAENVNAIRANGGEPVQYKKTISFADYFMIWLDTVKKPYIKDITYTGYLNVYKANLRPLYPLRMTDIRQSNLQKLISELNSEGKNRTAKSVYQILSPLFKYAYGDGLIPRNPMANVHYGVYEQDVGDALSPEAEKLVVEAFYANPHDLYLQAFVFILYTGLRRSELSTMEMSDNFVHVLTSKVRKGKKEKPRNIPISPMLRRLLPMIDIKAITALKCNMLTRRFTKLARELKIEYHLHELRHTFATRCKECKCDEMLISIWSGHSIKIQKDDTITKKTYIHLDGNTELQLAEIQKVDYDL